MIYRRSGWVYHFDGLWRAELPYGELCLCSRLEGGSGLCPQPQADPSPGTNNTEYALGNMSAARAWTRGRTTLKTLTTALAAAALGAFGLLGAAQAQDKGTVGVAMPTKSSARWIDDGNNMVKVLKEKAAIDGTTLSDALQQAADKGIKVIAYDRLIRNSKNVDYYATFDNFQVGVLQGGYIEKALGLKEGKGPFNIELFGGSPDDNNAFFFYNGAMSVLDPYIKSGKLKVASGQTGMDKVSTLRWDGAVAQARMDNLLSAYYTDKRVDAVLSPYDGLSIGIISSLKGVGYGTPKQPMPVITGQDAEVQSVKSILAKEQTSTVFKDTRELAKVTVNMVDAVLSGKQPEVNDTKTYENGVKTVPSYLLKPVSVDASNWKEVLVGSGYYKEDQFK